MKKRNLLKTLALTSGAIAFGCIPSLAKEPEVTLESIGKYFESLGYHVCKERMSCPVALIDAETKELVELKDHPGKKLRAIEAGTFEFTKLNELLRFSIDRNKEPSHIIGHIIALYTLSNNVRDFNNKYAIRFGEATLGRDGRIIS